MTYSYLIFVGKEVHRPELIFSVTAPELKIRDTLPIVIVNSTNKPLQITTVSIAISVDWKYRMTELLKSSRSQHKNINRHTTHTIVSWPNPKQCVIVHTSNLMMIIRQSIYIFSQSSQGKWVIWKHTAPQIIYWITERISLKLKQIRNNAKQIRDNAKPCNDRPGTILFMHPANETTALQYNAISYWLGAYKELPLRTS